MTSRIKLFIGSVAGISLLGGLAYFTPEQIAEQKYLNFETIDEYVEFRNDLYDKSGTQEITMDELRALISSYNIEIEEMEGKVQLENINANNFIEKLETEIKNKGMKKSLKEIIK